MQIMSTLNNLENATSLEELNNIINSIPNQDNGEKPQIKTHLDHINWYDDLIGNFEASKAFCIKIAKNYN